MCGVDCRTRTGTSGTAAEDGLAAAVEAQMRKVARACEGASLVTFNLASSFVFHVAEVRGRCVLAPASVRGTCGC